MSRPDEAEEDPRRRNAQDHLPERGPDQAQAAHRLERAAPHEDPHAEKGTDEERELVCDQVGGPIALELATV